MRDRLERQKNDALTIVVPQRIGHALRSLGYRMPIYGLRLKGKHPLKLLASPHYPWPGEAEKGARLIAGDFEYAGCLHTITQGDIWLKTAQEGSAYVRWLQGFSWLRHLAAASDQVAAKRVAERLVTKWLELYREYHTLAWQPAITGERLTMWLCYAPLILSSGDMVYRSAVLNSMARQARHLNRAVLDVPEGPKRIAALTGLVHSGLFIPYSETRLEKALKKLEKTLSTSILPDGGPLSRSPADGLAILRNLLLLRSAFDERRIEEPPWLQTGMDKIVPFLKALTQDDGHFATFNGTYSEDAAVLKDAIERSRATGSAIHNMTHSGYRRVVQDGSMLILDAGPPPKKSLSGSAHAGTLGFEFTSGGNRLVVNMGGTDQEADTGDRDISALSRTSAAHSTLVFSNTNSTELLSDGTMGKGPVHVISERKENEDGVWIEAEHDGYLARFGFIHQRKLFLSLDGRDFRGEDRLIPGPQKAFSLFGRKKPQTTHIRFHLHPDVSCSATQDGIGIILKLANKQGWLFRARGGDVGLEDSLYLSAPSRKRKSSQIVITTRAEEPGATVNWSFRRMEK